MIPTARTLKDNLSDLIARFNAEPMPARET